MSNLRCCLVRRVAVQKAMAQSARRSNRNYCQITT